MLEPKIDLQLPVNPVSRLRAIKGVRKFLLPRDASGALSRTLHKNVSSCFMMTSHERLDRQTQNKTTIHNAYLCFNKKNYRGVGITYAGARNAAAEKLFKDYVMNALEDVYDFERECWLHKSGVGYEEFLDFPLLPFASYAMHSMIKKWMAEGWDGEEAYNKKIARRRRRQERAERLRAEIEQNTRLGSEARIAAPPEPANNDTVYEGRVTRSRARSLAATLPIN